MSANINVEQNANLGSKSVNQIAEQNNFFGLTPTDAFNMLCRMFHEFCPTLKENIIYELREDIIKKLSKIPNENIVPASSRIAVPALLNAIITEESDKEIRKLYANLLASSMNKVVKNGVHPSYVETIKQLCPDEAKILKYIAEKNEIPTISLYVGDHIVGTRRIIKDFSDAGYLTHCEKPLDITKYFINFVRLGLVEIPDSSPTIHYSLSDEKLYESLKKHPYIQSYIDELNSKGDSSEVIEGYASMTDYGIGFCKICLDNQMSSDSINRTAVIDNSAYLTNRNVATDEEFEAMMKDIGLGK